MRIVQRMRIGEQARQGDLLILKIGEFDSRFYPAELIGDGVLAIGETTGHAHRVVASLNEIFLPADLEFLRKQQELLDQPQDNSPHSLERMKVLDDLPIVFKDKDTRPRERIIGRIRMVQDVIAKIHSSVPFYIVHHNQRTRVIPLDSKELVRQDDVHEAMQLPPGFYKVIQQGEFVYTGTGKIERVID